MLNLHKNNVKLRVLFLVFLFHSHTMADHNNLAEFSRRLAIFTVNLYGKLSLLKPEQNIVFSPFSIQTCGAMVRMGAEAETAEELDRGLGLVSTDVDEVAESYFKVLSAYEDSNILKIANKIYIQDGTIMRPEFNEIIKNKFLSSAETIDFGKSEAAAKSINQWVESKTNNLIKDLISPDALNSLTRMVLMNAIYFKGEWVHQFPKDATRSEKFYLNNNDSQMVQMMNVKKKFRYAELPELNATALEMPYKNSDLSMLVILPNERDGLKQLENKLKSTPLAEITNKMYSTQVIVKFPKFKAEFEIELKEPFEQLGMHRLFTDKAEFGKIFTNPSPLYVSKIIHKAFIEVSEEGTEAAAATAFRVMPVFGLRRKKFFATHPFIYLILKQDFAIFFTGVYLV